MGYMRHHAIVVTSWDVQAIEKAHREAVARFPAVSPLMDSEWNHYLSFFIPPDGSKEGWDASDEYDDCRKSFIQRLDSEYRDDGATSLDWVEVQYGDDEGETIVTAHSDQRWRRKPAAEEPSP